MYYDPDDSWPGYDNHAEEQFYEPGGHSALRAGVRKFPCPTCKEPNSLTQADVDRKYQCDDCADRAEGNGYGRGDY